MYEEVDEKQIEFKNSTEKKQVIANRSVSYGPKEIKKSYFQDRQTPIDRFPDNKKHFNNFTEKVNYYDVRDSSQSSFQRINKQVLNYIKKSKENTKNKKNLFLLLNKDKFRNNNLGSKSNRLEGDCIREQDFVEIYKEKQNNELKMFHPELSSDSHKIDKYVPRLGRDNHENYLRFDLGNKEKIKNQPKLIGDQFESEPRSNFDLLSHSSLINEPNKNLNIPINNTDKMQYDKIKEESELFMYFIKDINRSNDSVESSIQKKKFERPMYYKYKRDDIHDTLCLISESSAFGSDGNEQFSCSFCNMKYTYRRCLMNHIKKKHRGKVK